MAWGIKRHEYATRGPSLHTRIKSHEYTTRWPSLHTRARGGQALITAVFGRESANLSGDIHERDETGLMTGIIPKQEVKGAIDNYSDLINNQWGQRWGEALAKDLGITQGSKWTPEQTAGFLNGLQIKLHQSMNLQFKDYFEKDDDFIKNFTDFINKNK